MNRNLYLALLVMLGIVTLILFLSGCAVPERLDTGGRRSTEHESPFLTRSCMPQTRSVPRETLPPSVGLVVDIAAELFLCEFKIGAPVRFYGSTISINGQEFRKSYGYALLEKKTPLPQFLSGLPVLERYWLVDERMKLSVVRETKAIPGLLQVIPTYFVYAESRRYPVPPQLVAALSVIDFPEAKQWYRLIMWIEEYPLSRDQIAVRFHEMMRGFVPPTFESAETIGTR